MAVHYSQISHILCHPWDLVIYDCHSSQAELDASVLHVHVCVYLYMYMYVYIYTCICMCISTHVHVGGVIKNAQGQAGNSYNQTSLEACQWNPHNPRLYYKVAAAERPLSADWRRGMLLKTYLECHPKTSAVFPY